MHACAGLAVETGLGGKSLLESKGIQIFGDRFSGCRCGVEHVVTFDQRLRDDLEIPVLEFRRISRLWFWCPPFFGW